MKSNHIDEYVSSGTSPTSSDSSKNSSAQSVLVQPDPLLLDVNGTAHALNATPWQDSLHQNWSPLPHRPNRLGCAHRPREVRWCGMTTVLNPVQKYMLRLVLFGAGKTIFHKGIVCEVIETHNQICRLLPLVDGDLSEAKATPFWVPRKAAIRKEKKKERIRRQYVQGTRRVFSYPHYTGQPRPSTHPDDGVPLVFFVLKSLTPSPESSGALSSTLSKRVPSHIFREIKWKGFHLVQSVPVSTTRRTSQNFFSRESVNKALEKMRTHNVMKAGLVEVVFGRQSPSKIARIYGLPLNVLKVYATRLRKRIITQNPNSFTNKNLTKRCKKPRKTAICERKC
jgi:hypothetical protein